jgi:hypothetical protein
LFEGKPDQAKQEWLEAVSSTTHLEKEEAQKILSNALLLVAQLSNLELVQQLIRESDLGEPLFPLARAIDYMLTGEEALIEKLSPEVRGIVEEIVASLRNVADQSKQPKTKIRASHKSMAKGKPKATKSKPASRNRIRKRLQ